MKLPSSAIASAAALFILVSPVIAHGSHSNKRHANYLKRMSNVVNAKEPRQLVATGGGSSSASHTTSQSHSSASATATPPPPPPAAPTTLDGNAIPPLSQITSGMPTQGTVPLSETFAPGATPPIAGAPPIPTAALVIADYPPLDAVPPTNSSEVQEWLSVLQGVNIPNLSITKDGSCASDPAAAADTSRCWWTCGQCTRPTDITTCPDKLTWGVSFDDGPSPWTPHLLNYLDSKSLKSTFFVVGSRVISRPDILLNEYLSGHELSVHTWSHTPLTTLTNEQIVAELGWTRKAIKDVTGVSPITMRPPYGDIDDRVRAVCMAMGITPIIWTNDGDTQFDTDDWRIPGGTANGTSSFAAFEQILQLANTIDTGFIVLEHDLYQETVDMAVGYFLPTALSSTNPKFTLKSIMECQGAAPGDAYAETNTNKTTSGSNSSQNGSPSSSSKAPSSTNSAIGVVVPVHVALAGAFILVLAGLHI